MFITVLIPVFNDPRLEPCLEALARQTIGSDRFEVIVIDNGSEISPREVVEKFPFARYTQEIKTGSFAARNHGLTLTRGQVYAFTDADCLPAEDWLERSVAALTEANESIVVGGRVDVFPRDPHRPRMVEIYDIAYGFDQERTIKEAGYSVTANLIASRESFERVGLFNDKMLSGADGEWCQRAGAIGIPTKYVDDAVVAHPARETLEELLRKRKRTVGGRLVRNSKRSVWNRFRAAVRNLAPSPSQLAYGLRRLAERGYRHAGLKLLAITLVTHYVGVFEYVRLKLGGTSERR
ncbi:glycosyltransferase [Botrimarina hoheduenensis]|uniref:Putative glycosyltransferase EpsH n=1 Tax=Botrimarina hoheduenensis TaxID=2528000 RepID=A0A5C5WA47_9BACT|nr:glycosyltransferase [Botrimarina hoheduenensis]TWT47367.1 putative glycosyltransferase EpsH [Botrimarina hoheduenensis]